MKMVGMAGLEPATRHDSAHAGKVVIPTAASANSATRPKSKGGEPHQLSLNLSLTTYRASQFV